MNRAGTASLQARSWRWSLPNEMRTLTLAFAAGQLAVLTYCSSFGIIHVSCLAASTQARIAGSAMTASQ